MGCCFRANFTFTVHFYVNSVAYVVVTFPGTDVTYMAATPCNTKKKEKRNPKKCVFGFA